MKSTALIAASVAVVAASTSQKDAYLYAIDQSVHSSSTQYIDADLANSIVARRRGLTNTRYLNIADESILDDLNTFGGWQQPLFGEGKGETPGKLFIRISGFDGDFNDLGDQLPDLLIEQPTTSLRDDFKATSRREGICEYTVPPSVNSPDSTGVEVIFTYPQEDEPSCLPEDDIPHIPVILSLNSVLPTSPKGITPGLGPLTRILRHLSATQNVESTVLILPSKLIKSKANTHTHHHKVRSNPEETPLDLPIYPTLSPVTITASNGTKGTKHPLPSVIPACFSSADSCANTTNSCSGHGKCYAARKNCYKCKCQATVVRTNEDGSKKTIIWAGGACEKKDVSVPFILFSFFGIFMLTIVSGAIGMLYSMGSAELPKVLSAGVGGGRAGQK